MEELIKFQTVSMKNRFDAICLLCASSSSSSSRAFHKFCSSSLRAHLRHKRKISQSRIAWHFNGTHTCIHLYRYILILKNISPITCGKKSIYVSHRHAAHTPTPHNTQLMFYFVYSTYYRRAKYKIRNYIVYSSV